MTGVRQVVDAPRTCPAAAQGGIIVSVTQEILDVTLYPSWH